MRYIQHFFQLLWDLLRRPFLRYTLSGHKNIIPYTWYSRFLKRRVKTTIFLPPNYAEEGPYPVVFFNDGQDMKAAGMERTLQNLWEKQALPELIVVAFHAGDRIQEYGVIGQPDYQKRGSRAAQYAQAIILEFMPIFRKWFRASEKAEENAFAGFSLGGLSAFDIVWNHPHFFGKAGVFSGSFWWRSEPFDPNDPDAHRIMHQVVADSHLRPGQKFWFQTGTQDEKADRNQNGVIDSIDDTLALIEALKKLGYSDQSITYFEVEGGKHEPKTWGKVLPDFLKWAFPKEQSD